MIRGRSIASMGSMANRRRVATLSVAAAHLLLTPSCSIFNTGRSYYTALDYDKVPLREDTRAQVRSCLDAANDVATRAGDNRKLDLAFIYMASIVGSIGLGMTTASTFVSETHDGGRPTDLKQDMAAVGAISVGVSAGLLALRTALNLGELAGAQVSSASQQASLIPQIVDQDADPTKREALYAKCVGFVNDPNTAYPADEKAKPTNSGDTQAQPQPAPSPAPAGTPAGGGGPSHASDPSQASPRAH